MAHLKKFGKTATGHMTKHYERAKDEFGEYIKFGNQDIDTSKTHLNYNLASNGSNQVEFIKNRCKEVKCLNREDVKVMCSWIVTKPKNISNSEERDFFGSGRVLNFDILQGSEQIKQNIGYMSQKFGLYEDLTVMENLNFYAQIYSIPKTERIRKINDVINISNLDSKKTQLTSTLSGGWKQRLALSCVLIHKPKLLILDEPTSAVDPVSRRIFWNIIHKLSSEGISIIVTTHYMDEAETCDKIAFVFDGEIIGLGSPNELIKNMNVYSLEDVFIKYVEKKCSDTIPH